RHQRALRAASLLSADRALPAARVGAADVAAALSAPRTAARAGRSGRNVWRRFSRRATRARRTPALRSGWSRAQSPSSATRPPPGRDGRSGGSRPSARRECAGTCPRETRGPPACRRPARPTDPSRTTLRRSRRPSSWREFPRHRGRSGGARGPLGVRSMEPAVVVAGRGLDSLLGARDVLLLQLLEVGDTRHHVMALGRVTDLRLLEAPLRLFLVAHQLLHRVPDRVRGRVGRVERDEDELVAERAQLLEGEWMRIL